MAQPEVAAFVRAHYELVTIDIGRYDRNMQIPARYGLPTQVLNRRSRPFASTPTH